MREDDQERRRGCFGKTLLASGGSLHYFPSPLVISKSPKPVPVQGFH
jgi:hypothetical protein